MIIFGLLAHFIADFIFQPNCLINEKRKNLFKGNIFHALIVFFTVLTCLSIGSYLITEVLISIKLILISLLLTLAHLFIDILKSLVLKIFKNNDYIDLMIFYLDQILHVIIIYLVLIKFYNNLYIDSYLFNVLFITIIYIIAIFFGDFTIRKVLKLIKINIYEKHENEIKGIGSYIGKIERFIILTMFIINHFEIAIAVIGIKSIARYPELTDRNKYESNDYFILGNLLSLLIVIVCYVLYLLK